jgi:hypothetical protein
MYKKIFPKTLVTNLCLPTSLDSIIEAVNKSEIIQALYNIQMIGSINGVS